MKNNKIKTNKNMIELKKQDISNLWRANKIYLDFVHGLSFPEVMEKHNITKKDYDNYDICEAIKNGLLHTESKIVQAMSEKALQGDVNAQKTYLSYIGKLTNRTNKEQALFEEKLMLENTIREKQAGMSNPLTVNIKKTLDVEYEDNLGSVLEDE